MRVLVVGFGGFGSWFSRTMLEMGHEVVVIERDGALVDRLADWATRAVEGDATDRDVLERAGAASADAAVISTAQDLATSVLATVALRDLGVREVYAKVRSVNEARALEALDVREAVFPEREVASRLAHRIVSRSVLDYVALAPGYSIQEVAVPRQWIGRTLVELEPRTQLGIQVIAVRDALTESIAVPPDPTAPLKDSDSVLLAGRDETLAELLATRDR